ncbi:hypothetical protein LTR94_032443, partial [Friedmanniomyces endolithicus]
HRRGIASAGWHRRRHAGTGIAMATLRIAGSDRLGARRPRLRKCAGNMAVAGHAIRLSGRDDGHARTDRRRAAARPCRLRRDLGGGSGAGSATRSGSLRL